MSCASCHQPDHAFADGRERAVGLQGQVGTRNTPTLLNAAFSSSFFWDGRRDALEDQVGDPLLNPREHGLANEAAVLATVRRDPSYGQAFARAFGIQSEQLSMREVRSALAAFVRSLATAHSAFDRYRYGGDATALSESAERGLRLFEARAQCTNCHTINAHDALFTDQRFHAAGVEAERIAPKLAELTARINNTPESERRALIGADPDVAALGRFVVTLKPRDIGAFKTPSLRDVARTAPYMHDGSVPTLEAAVDHEIYYRSAEGGRPLIITPSERADLVSFLRALDSAPLRQPNLAAVQ